MGTMSSAPAAPPERAASSFEEQLRALRQDKRNVALPGLAACYVGVAAMLVAPLWGPWWLPLALIVPMGILQYRIVLSGHEAVHKNLAQPEALNELLGVFGQALVGVNFASYRVQHLDHHRATRLLDDPDGHIYGPIVAARPGFPRIVTWLLGTFWEIAVKVVQKGIGSVGTGAKVSDQTKALSRRHTLYVVLAQLSLLAWSTWVTGRITGYAEMWIVPLFGVAVLLNRTRIFVEHGVALLHQYEAGAARLPTVDMRVPGWERFVLAPFGFAWHCSHHLHMTVPQYNLPRLHELLREHGSPGYREIEGSYLSTVWRAMWR
jgi:fatty acid desaturase